MMGYLAFLGFVFIFCIGGLRALPYSKQLFDDLFSEDRYSPQLLPDCGTHKSVNVSFNMALRQIIDLDEKAQMLSVNVWIRMTWNDCNLVWNASQYGDTASLLVNYADVWAPDLANYDSLAEEEMMPGYDRFKARISSNGTVTYLYPTVLRTICRVKVTYFPFDVQTCKIIFGSWSHIISEIDFHPGFGNALPDDVSYYIENNEWINLSLEGTFKSQSYPLGSYRMIEFQLRLQRRPAFYLLIMVFPCIFVNVVALLGCFLPAESGEKVSLEVTILLSLAVFLLVISDLLPPDSDNYPLLGLFFACSMVLVGLRLVACVFILKLHHSGSIGKRVPDWARRIILGRLGKLFCDKSDTETHSPDKYYVDEIRVKSTKESFKEHDISLQEYNRHTEEILENNIHSNNHVNSNNAHHNIHGGQTESSPHRNNVRSLDDDCFNKILDYLDTVHLDSTRDQEWVRLARIIDRLCFVVFGLGYVILFIVFLSEIYRCINGECSDD